ncbi:hypothetical protein OJ997_00620 [Solirubrobacter phytolaccae]|uniref:Uncharacterized protein n=1 Tax=Solirubrobacter phytolaccae TaxID=1404360 RepID=A0A9X3N6S6_9ACTN|nr:hypothetical protein [Solirubrobacter phytolaccae]MDA0178781.1 hypothetical protein [Solirubrobacter phytolaccae]
MPDLLAMPLPDGVGELLDGQALVTAEWSLRLAGGSAAVRPHLTFWIGGRGHPGNAAAFAAVGRLLGRLDAPQAMRRVQLALADVSVRQGVAVVGREAVSLYVHSARAGGGPDRYRAYKRRGDAVTASAYTFERFETAARAREARAHVHPALRRQFGELLRDARLIDRSGWWRRRAEQVCITYPWLPPVDRVVGLGGDMAGLEPYRRSHLRHVSLAGRGAESPAVTLYFSGPLTATPWPRTFADVQARVDESARVLNGAIEGR